MFILAVLVSFVVPFYIAGFWQGIITITAFFAASFIRSKIDLNRGQFDWLDFLRYLIFFGYTSYLLAVHNHSSWFIGNLILQMVALYNSRSFFYGWGVSIGKMKL